MFSTIPTCVHLPGGVIFLSVYLRLIGVLQGNLLIVAHFYIFLTVFGTFLITDYLFCDLLLGSDFPPIITIICINNKINEM